MIGELVALLIVALVLVGAGVFVTMDNATSKPDPTKSKEYRELRAVLLNVRELVQSNRDVNPVFSDVILNEIDKYERKELNG